MAPMRWYSDVKSRVVIICLPSLHVNRFETSLLQDVLNSAPYPVWVAVLTQQVFLYVSIVTNTEHSFLSVLWKSVTWIIDFQYSQWILERRLLIPALTIECQIKLGLGPVARPKLENLEDWRITWEISGIVFASWREIHWILLRAFVKHR